MTLPQKPYELRFEQRDGYLYARIHADTMNAEIATAYLTEIAEKCNELKCKRLLIERDVRVMLPLGDLLYVTDYFRKLVEGIRVAFVNPHEAIETDMQVAIIMGTNRGANYDLFPSIESAEKWLRDAG